MAERYADLHARRFVQAGATVSSFIGLATLRN
jgi:hypothetical protein